MVDNSTRKRTRNTATEPSGRMHNYGARFLPTDYERIKQLAERESKSIGYPVSICSVIRKFVLVGLAQAELE